VNPKARIGRLKYDPSDCLSDMPICCAGWWCPSGLTALNWAAVRGEEIMCNHAAAMGGQLAWTHANVMYLRGMPVDPGSILSGICCPSCLICSDTREIRDMKLLPPVQDTTVIVVQ
jgi:hypothetical protein